MQDIIEQVLNCDCDPELANQIIDAYIERRLTRQQAFECLVERAGIHPDVANDALEVNTPPTLH